MMTETNVPHPTIASRDEWLAARKQLLAKEKELTRRLDTVNAERRRLPMVRLDKDYVFERAGAKARLLDLFEDRRQLIVYHFMFDPGWDKGCPGCTGFVDALGDLSMLRARNTTFVLVSRAPLPKLEAYKTLRGWNLPWVSSYGSPFNYDFHVTHNESNYRDKAELEQRTHEPYFMSGESHGLSIFFRVNDDVFHSYSTYARGCEGLTDAYSLLDRTPYGRQEDCEDSPPGWPQKPTYE
jgi:predicted dithiol-disulfide oxidoreductase (DUF899 family)